MRGQSSGLEENCPALPCQLQPDRGASVFRPDRLCRDRRIRTGVDPASLRPRPFHGIRKHPANGWVVISWVRFMTRTEIKDLPIPALPTTTAPKNVAAFE